MVTCCSKVTYMKKYFHKVSTQKLITVVQKAQAAERDSSIHNVLVLKAWKKHEWMGHGGSRGQGIFRRMKGLCRKL